jgi:transposase-like protein
MEARQVIEEILSKGFKWHSFPVSLKAEAVILYFKRLFLRTVKKFLLHKGYKVSIETIREWFYAVGKSNSGNIHYSYLVICGRDKGKTKG